MKRSRRVSPVGISLVATLVLVATGVTQAQEAQSCPDGSANVTRIEVNIDYDGGKINVSVDPATIYMEEGPGRPGRVCWVVENLQQGLTLHIESKDDDSFFPQMKHRIQAENSFANSGRPAKAGSWGYSLRVEGSEGQVAFTDPEVIIVGGGGH